MAYDLWTKKVSGRNWSISGSESDGGGSGSSLGTKIAPLLTIGAIGLGVWVISNQPSARQLQESHLRTWHRKAGA